MINVGGDSGELVLAGLDGTNPLGFLAALGVLRVVSDTRDAPGPRLRWSEHGGTWVPTLCSTDLQSASLLDLFDAELVRAIEEHPVSVALRLNDAEAARKEAFQTVALESAWDRRLVVDWVAALASDVVSTGANNQLQTTRRDYHLGNLVTVIQATTREHLERSLFVAWDYGDALNNQSLHLDPTEDRRHAYQWNQPAGDPDRKRAGGMLGANRLAIEAFPLFTSLPHGETLRTLGFTGQRSRDTRWTWPIWTVPLELSTVPTALGLSELQEDSIDTATGQRLRERGIQAAYRTNRILVGKTPNFTPPIQVA